MVEKTSRFIPKDPRTVRVLAIAGSVLLLVLVAWALIGSGLGEEKGLASSMAGGETVFEVKRGPLTVSFTEKGTVKAVKSTPVYCHLEKTNTIVNLVPEGTFVKKDEVLMEIDSSELTQLFNQQQITVEQSAADLKSAKEAVAIQRSQNESDIKAAELAVKLAEIDVEKYEKGDWPLALANAQASIKIAEEELKRAQNRYNWTAKLAEKGYVTGTELIVDELAVSRSQVQHDEAKRALDVLENWTRTKEKMTMTSNLDQAKRALLRTRLKAEAEMAQVDAAYSAKQSTHELSVSRLEKIKDQLAKTQIIAPQDGMVVYVTDGGYRGREDRIIEQGGSVRENQHLFNLPDLALMGVEVSVPEARVHQVSQGLPVLVTVDAGTEINFSAQIEKIGLLPDYGNRWLNPDLKVYETEITIDPRQDTTELRPGMSAKVEIMVAELEDVIYVPVQSVTAIDGAPVCYVFEDGKFTPRPVQVGLSNDSFVVVSSGLEEGERVQLNAPRPKGVAPLKGPGKRRPEAFGDGEDGPPSAAELGRGPGGQPVPASYRQEGKAGGPGKSPDGTDARDAGPRRGAGKKPDRERARGEGGRPRSGARPRPGASS